MIYLDHQATTPCDARVVEAMAPYWSTQFGNAASRHHAMGREALNAVEEARDAIGSLIGASGDEICFTSGATEADNLALKGAAFALRKQGHHIISQQTEHKAVLDTLSYLEGCGFEVTYLDVDAEGRISPEAFEAAIRKETILASVMAANNEIGTLQPLAEIGAICKAKGICFHVDAVQAAGLGTLNMDALGIDLCALSSHKLYGPKGVGALYVRTGTALCCQMHGGGHEGGLRSGTLPVSLCVGFGKAAEIAKKEGPEEAQRVGALALRLYEGLRARLTHVRLNGPAILSQTRLPCNVNLSFACVLGDDLLAQLPEICASTGSACNSASIEPSYVLRAIGLSDRACHESVRFSLGRCNDAAQVDRAVDQVVEAVSALRACSLEWEQLTDADACALETDD